MRMHRSTEAGSDRGIGLSIGDVQTIAICLVRIVEAKPCWMMAAGNVKTFSLATLMIAVMIAALLMLVSRLGFWPCIIASAIAGSLALTTIPAAIRGSPRYAFMVVGAIGAIFGCWLGSRIAAAFIEQPTDWISNQEYQRVFWTHVIVAAVELLCACLVGCIIGIGMYSFAGRPTLRTRVESSHLT